MLYKLVQEHIDVFLESADERYEKGLPRYVVEEFQSYLRCGIFAHGFTRCHCDSCGHDLLVAFSCKRRGICPSCSSRRMCNEAAHLVDRVLPNVPIRQWVLSLSYELRGLLPSPKHASDVATRAILLMTGSGVKRNPGENTTIDVGRTVQSVRRCASACAARVLVHLLAPAAGPGRRESALAAARLGLHDVARERDPTRAAGTPSLHAGGSARP
ncbi:transposase zinc-binding domain-containing protein [Sorangium sp. So ce1128]